MTWIRLYTTNDDWDRVYEIISNSSDERSTNIDNDIDNSDDKKLVIAIIILVTERSRSRKLLI